MRLKEKLKRIVVGFMMLSLVVVTVSVLAEDSSSLPAKDATVENKLTPTEARAIAKEAYIYGFPMVMNCKTIYGYVINKNSPDYKGPFNQVSCEAGCSHRMTKPLLLPMPIHPIACSGWILGVNR